MQLLSVLFRNPNFLILDEPTNDLDLPTLSVLENFLSEFQGCLLIVSHDRYFMDRLVDHLFVFEGDGVVRDFPGNYTEYRLDQRTEQAKAPAAENKMKEATKSTGGTQKPKKLSYKELREFEQLEKEIPTLEKEKAEIAEQMSSPNLAYETLQTLSARITQITQDLEDKEMRWLELSEHA